jgi:hypothetical protein
MICTDDVGGLLGHPFHEGEWYPIRELRAVEAEMQCKRKADPDLSAKMRENALPWAKSWNEELRPFKLFVDQKKISDEDTFCWTPAGAYDFELRSHREAVRIQSTMAYAERHGTIGKQGGHVHKLEMRHYNTHGYAYGGGLISAPKARSEVDDVQAWRLGIERSLRKKLRPGYAGCRLLIFAPRCGIDTVDFDFKQVVVPAIEAVGRAAWERVFKGIYILDDFSLVEVQPRHPNWVIPGAAATASRPAAR